MKPYNIVLVEPEIPQNTGNIARTCAATGCSLHLVEPLGYEIDDKKLKRAGLDYWHLLDIHYYNDLSHFMSVNSENKDLFYFLSTKACHTYCEVEFPEGAYFIFGKETRGLDEELLHNNYEKTLRIPMIEDARSLNLSNSVAIVVYEALRQINFKGLQEMGKLTKF